MKIIEKLFNTLKSSKLSKHGRGSLEGVHTTKTHYVVTNGHFLIQTPKPEEDKRENILLVPDPKNYRVIELDSTSYPDVKLPLEEAKKATFIISLNGDYIAKIASVLCEGTNKDLIFHLNPQGPCYVRNKYSKTEAVIMPVRIEE